MFDYIITFLQNISTTPSLTTTPIKSFPDYLQKYSYRNPQTPPPTKSLQKKSKKIEKLKSKNLHNHFLKPRNHKP